MFEIEKIPGPCCFCYQVFLELKRIPGGFGDGVCEGCDEVRHRVVGRPWVSWGEQKARLARKAQEQAAKRPQVVVPAPVRVLPPRPVPARGRSLLAV